jgi:secreted PhoX family phosphatase
VTRIDLETGDTAVVISYLDHDFRNLDGLLWTAWGTLLVSEEAPGGRLFEILDPMAQPGEAQFVERTAFGRRKHEGLAMDERGYLYGVDEASEGGIYRFRPDAPLTADALLSGTLEVLDTDADLSELDRGRVAASWEPAETADHAGFNRPEDIEIARDTLYVALTGADQVISVDLSDPDNPTIGLFADSEATAPGLTWPDNLASDPHGNLYITENIGASRYTGQRNQLWAATASQDPLAPAEKVELFATLNSPRDEFSGVLVDGTGDRLFVNVLGPDNFILMVPLSH